MTTITTEQVPWIRDETIAWAICTGCGLPTARADLEAYELDWEGTGHYDTYEELCPICAYDSPRYVPLTERMDNPQGPLLQPMLAPDWDAVRMAERQMQARGHACGPWIGGYCYDYDRAAVFPLQTTTCTRCGAVVHASPGHWICSDLFARCP